MPLWQNHFRLQRANPQAKAAAAAAADDPWAAAITAFLKQIQITLFNKTPTATATGPEDADDGTYIGQIVGDDADDDPLSYTRNVNPTHGTISLDGDGNYVYTPDTDILATGGTDSFTIEVIETNAGTHYHGLIEILARAFYPYEPAGLPNPQSFSRAHQKVTVTIAAPSSDGSVSVTFSLPEASDPTLLV